MSADTRDLGSLLAAVQEQITCHNAADAAVEKHDKAAKLERDRRAAARQALYDLRAEAAGSVAAKGAVDALLREASISIPPSKR
jgi:uncharacterized protein YaiL (DUF2058 family)